MFELFNERKHSVTLKNNVLGFLLKTNLYIYSVFSVLWHNHAVIISCNSIYSVHM